jgi:hypothetical protein
MSQHIYDQLDTTAETHFTTSDRQLAELLILASWETRLVRTLEGEYEYVCTRSQDDARAAQTRLAHEMAARLEVEA